MIDGMFQAGTDRALDDQMQRPRPQQPTFPSFSYWDLMKAPGQGVGGGVAKMMAFGAEISGAFGQVQGAAGAYSSGGMFSTQSQQEREDSEAQRRKLMTQGLEMSNEAGETFRRRAAEILPDPNTTHASAQVVAGLFDFGTQAVGYTMGLGPAGPLALAGDVGLTEADRLKQQGVDLSTRTKAGTVAGGLAGLSVVLPMTGPTAAVRFGKGLAIGEGTLIGQAAAEKLILEHAGYDKIADTFDPFDPVSLALGIVPGALGAKFGRPAAKPITKPLRTDADVRAAAELTPAERARSDAFEASAGNLRELEAAIKAEKNPESRALLEAELQKQRTAAAGQVARAALEARPELEPAARVSQVVDALESSRLTPEADLPGRDAHVRAVEMAADQMAAGDPVRVAEVVDVGRIIEPLDAFMARTRITPEPVAPEVRGNFLGWLNERGGVAMAEKADITGEAGGVRGNPAGIFRRNGMQLDELARAAEADGYLVPGAVDSALDNGGTRALAELIRRAVSGERILNVREQAAKAARDQHEASLASRLTDVERRLQRLGVDTEPAKGNVAALEAYAKQHEPALLAAALDDVRSASAAAQASELAAPLRSTAQQIAADIRDSARTLPQFEAEVSPLSPVMRRMVADELAQGRATEGAGVAAAQATVGRAASEVAQLNPDMLVQLDGMDAPVRVSELLARVKEEAAADTRDSKLLQVAAACALRT